MAQIVTESYGLHQILIEPQGPCHSAGKAADLKGVGKAGAVMVALGLQKDLSLVLQAAEGLGVGYSVDIPLVAGADIALLLRVQPAFGLFRQLPVGADDKVFQLLALFTGTIHGAHLL